MKRVYLLRHAKSSWKDRSLADRDRPLARRGRRAAKAMSAHLHAEEIRRPLIVLQGANDPRVLKAESDEIVEAVRSNGVPVEYVLFEDEGHGFVKKENEIEGYAAVLGFLDRHLKGES